MVDQADSLTGSPDHFRRRLRGGWAGVGGGGGLGAECSMFKEGETVTALAALGGAGGPE